MQECFDLYGFAGALRSQGLRVSVADLEEEGVIELNHLASDFVEDGYYGMFPQGWCQEREIELYSQGEAYYACGSRCARIIVCALAQGRGYVLSITPVTASGDAWISPLLLRNKQLLFRACEDCGRMMTMLPSRRKRAALALKSKWEHCNGEAWNLEMSRLFKKRWWTKIWDVFVEIFKSESP